MRVTYADKADQEAGRALRVRWQRLSRRAGPSITIALAVAGPILGIATVLLLNRLSHGQAGTTLVGAVLLVDACYFLLLVGLLARRTVMLVASRRTRSAGAALHRKFAGTFTFIAAAPAILVAVVSTITLNFGFQSWYTERVVSVIENSQSVANTYIQEHIARLRIDSFAIARRIDLAFDGASRQPGAPTPDQVLQVQSAARDIDRAFVVDSTGAVRLKGLNSFLFHYERPALGVLAATSTAEPTVLRDTERGELRALLRLRGLPGHFLYIAHDVDATALRHVDLTRETAALYQSLEAERERILFSLGLFYVAFASLMTVSAAWLGFWFAERMARPVVRLARAAQRLGEGDLSARVPVKGDRDEISQLSRTFNQMAEQVGEQRDELMQARKLEESRRQFTEGVLTGVPVGVIGLGADRRIEVANRAVATMLERDAGTLSGRSIGDLLPQIEPLLDRAARKPSQVTQENIRINAGGNLREIVVRVSPERQAFDILGFVVTLEDLTELASAQRLAAWGEIARRIAHEIKNPLTPIQLAAERLRSKVGAGDEESRSILDRYTDVIVRQVQDISQLVDQFSRLAQLPTPHLRQENLREIVDDAVLLESAANETVDYDVEGAETLVAGCDRALISQALTNVLRNASQAIQLRPEASVPGRILICLERTGDSVRIDAEDNGIGFPHDGRAELLEPYRSNRPDGTGLGLAIVSRALEAHGGVVRLLDPPGGRPGSLVRLQFPLIRDPASSAEEKADDA